MMRPALKISPACSNGNNMPWPAHSTANQACDAGSLRAGGVYLAFALLGEAVLLITSAISTRASSIRPRRASAAAK